MPASTSKLAVGGRGVKRRADGVVYTRENKMIAIHYMFASSTSRHLNIPDRAKPLRVGKATLYEWRKELPEVWDITKAPAAGSELAQQLTAIRARSDRDNIAAFLAPNDHVAGILSTSSGGTTGSAGGANFSRPDGLGPASEPSATFTPYRPGDLPPEVVEILRRVEGGPDLTLAEQTAGGLMQVDEDVGNDVSLLVETTIDQTATLQRDSLRPSTNKLWDRPKQNFIMFWRGLSRLRAREENSSAPVEPSSGSSSSSTPPASTASNSTPNPAPASVPTASNTSSTTSANRPIIVTEQKLVTYLNCFVLHRNPRLGEEAIKTEVKAITNLWETQRILGINNHPSPRSGGLIKAYLKALSRGRAAHAEAVHEDWWKHSMRDGYDEQEYVAVARWFLQRSSVSLTDSFGASSAHTTSTGNGVASVSTSASSTSALSPVSGAISMSPSLPLALPARVLTIRQRWARVALRSRFEFLMQHALMGRSEDLRNAKLAATYTITAPQSRPQPATAFVVTLRSGKTNTTGRNEWGVAVRHKDVETCPVGALAMYLFERWHVFRKPFPIFDSRESWYQQKLLVSEEGEEEDGIDYEDQKYLLPHAFSEVGIASSKVTHAMRSGGARFAHEAGCTEDSLRIHGRWCGDRLIDRYLGGVAIQPMRALGGWNINGGNHWLPRTLVEPPAQLQQAIFPGLEAEEAKVQQRHQSGGETDHAAINFFQLLKWIRLVLLQDAVLLQPSFPNVPIWQHAPFNTPAFVTFAQTLTTAIANTPSPFEVTIASLIPQLGNALGGVQAAVTQLSLKAATTEDVERQAALTRTTIADALAGLVRALKDNADNEGARARAQRALALGAQQLATASVELASTSLISASNLSPDGDSDDEMEDASAIAAAAPAPQVSSMRLPSHPLPQLLLHSSSQFGTLRPPTPPTPPTPIVIPPAAHLSSPAAHPSNGVFTPPSVHLATTPLSILGMAPAIRTVERLMEEWRRGCDGRRSLKERVDAGDEQLEKGPGSARKQLSRWKLVVDLVEELALQSNESAVIALLDSRLKKDKVGLRTLAEKRDQRRADFIRSMGFSTDHTPAFNSNGGAAAT